MLKRLDCALISDHYKQWMQLKIYPVFDVVYLITMAIYTAAVHITSNVQLIGMTEHSCVYKSLKPYFNDNSRSISVSCVYTNACCWWLVMIRISDSWWRHQMETVSVLLVLCAGNSPVAGEFPSQRPGTRSFDVFSFNCARINVWVNNHEAGNLRRHLAHYDAIVMLYEERFRFHVEANIGYVQQILPLNALFNCIIPRYEGYYFVFYVSVMWPHVTKMYVKYAVNNFLLWVGPFI